MQPAAARVGPSNEPSVRKIAVRFSSGATIWIEKTIKVQFFRSFHNRQDSSPVFIARSGPTRGAISACEESPSKQRDKKSSGRERRALNAQRPPKFRRRLRNLGGVWAMPSTKPLLSKFST